jgi:hypothetical protein
MGFWSELFPGWLGGITDAYLSGYKYLDQADSAASIDQATKQKIDALTLEYLKKLNPEIPGDLAGNTLSTALPIGLGKQTGRINTSRDKDWYAVPVLKGYDYSITVVPNDSEGLTITPFHVVSNIDQWLHSKVLDSSGKLLDDWQPSKYGIPYIFRYKGQSDGAIFISVSPYYPDFYGNFEINIEAKQVNPSTTKTPTYSLSPSTTSINEGSNLTATINTTNVTSGTSLYWSAVGSGITTSDFSFGALSGSASIGSDGKATFSHVLANDLTTEGSETLNILLYSDSNRSNQVATTSIAINDTSIAPATPTVAVSGNNTGVINTGTINNSGTINSGTINTNSGNTTNTTTNTSNVTVGPTIINNITNTTTNTTSVLSNTSYPSYNVNNTWANNLVTGAITGSAPTLAKNSFDYKFYNLGGGRYGVQEKGSSKIDEITGASSLKFADQTLTPANDVAATFNQVKGKDDVSGVVFRLYNAAFSRLPDAKGLENWINGNAAGTVTYASSAQSFSESQEFKNRYGSNVTDTQFITTLYNNVLGRAPDAGGLSHYQSLLAGGRSRGALLLDFSESPENRVLFTQVTGLA